MNFCHKFPNRRHESLFHSALFSALILGVYSQHTEVQCTNSSLQWTFNSLNQSPCLIGAYLGSTCSASGDYDVPAIGPGYHYNPSPVPSLCECSTVVYSLYSACAACQNATISPWTLFIENCTETNADGVYPFNIPPETAIPAWAYQLVEPNNRFNLTLAQSVGDTPENKTIASSTSSASRKTNVSSGPTGSSIPTNNDQSKTPVGAIVGGVVGGVGGLALVGGLVAFFLLRRRKNRSQGEQYYDYDEKYDSLSHTVVGPGTVSASPPPGTSGQHYTALYHPVNPTLNAKPYDPEDPSTFPPSLGPEPTAGGDPSLIASSQGVSSHAPLSSEAGRWNNGNELRAEL